MSPPSTGPAFVPTGLRSYEPQLRLGPWDEVRAEAEKPAEGAAAAANVRALSDAVWPVVIIFNLVCVSADHRCR